MTKNLRTIFYMIFAAGFFLSNCQQNPIQFTEIKHYPVDNTDGIISHAGLNPDLETRMETDKQITDDGNGSLRIHTAKPATIQLYETGDIDIENAVLLYKGRLRTEDVEGQVYLEMWCQFGEKGGFFSRALHDPLSGSNEWLSQETPFFLKKGQNPDNVKLNIVINGIGTVWIDDIRLMKGPLK